MKATYTETSLHATTDANGAKKDVFRFSFNGNVYMVHFGNGYTHVYDGQRKPLRDQNLRLLLIDAANASLRVHHSRQEQLRRVAEEHMEDAS